MKKILMTICFCICVVMWGGFVVFIVFMPMFGSSVGNGPEKELFKEKIDRVFDSTNFEEPKFSFFYHPGISEGSPLIFGSKEIHEIYLTRANSPFGGKNYYCSLKFKISEEELAETSLQIIRFWMIIKTEEMTQHVSIIPIKNFSFQREIFDEEAKKSAFDFSMFILDEISKMENRLEFIKESDEVLDAQKIKQASKH